MKNLVNKNCLITGASHGIGRSLSMLLAKEGANLYITDIDMDNLQKTKDEIEGIGAKVISSKCDISKVEDFEKLAEDFSKQLGDVDILINNAGIAGGAFLEDLEFEEWKKILDINLWGIIHSLKVFLPKMLKRGSGHIINTGSGAGIVGLPFHPHYVASKFAVVGITEALYSEFSHRGLKFSVICPTRVKTNIINTSDIKIPRDMITSKDDKEYEDKYKEFKRIFWEKYSELGGLTPDEAAESYLKGIKREKLYIFDKKIIPLAMFIKGLSTRLYKKVLRKVYRDDFAAYTNALIESGLSKREDLIKPISIGKPIKLKNSNCVITGAASGIGRYLSILLAKEGMNLFLSDIDMENLEKVKKEIEDIGVKVFAGKCDISKYEDYEKLANDSYSKLGAIDMVINNAGTGIAGFSETLDLEQWRKVLDVNLWGIIHAIKAFIPRMLKRGSGHFIITGSGAGIVGLPFHIPYVASKFAIVGIAEALYSELWSKGLNFSVICPTKVQTNIARTAEFKLTDDMFKIEDQQIIHAKMNEFKDIFTEEYFDEGITPDLAAKRYLKRIKKGKLYVFDKKILPVAMFIKSVSKRLYKKVLKRECKKDIIALNNTLSRVGLKLKKR